VLLLTLTGFFFGCHGYSLTGGPGRTVTPRLVTGVSRNADFLHLNSIMLMPMEFDETARGRLAEQGVFTDELESALRRELAIKIVPAREVFPELRESERQNSLSPLHVSKEEALKRAAERGLDAVMAAHVHVYVERDGSRMGANQPAQVNFSVNLYRVRDGKEIWRANYNFKDQALAENLFRLQDRMPDGQKLGWRSAADLLRHGFEIAAQDLAKRRLAQFVPQVNIQR